jgi:hypothetical protein
MKCTFCGSEEVSKPKPLIKFIYIISLIFFLPLPNFNRNYHCFNCGKDFKYESRNKEDL